LGCLDPKNCGSKPPPIPFDACCGSCPEGKYLSFFGTFYP